MIWKECKIEDIRSNEKGSLVSGPFGSNIGSKFFVDEGIPVIRGNNLTLGKEQFIDDGYVFITASKAHELRNCIAKAGDIIFTAAGTLGQIGLIPDSTAFPFYIISNKQIRLRVNSSRCCPKFLYYYLSSPSMRAFIVSQNKGSSVPLLTLGIIRNLPVRLPDLPTQRKIAAILTAYDDLIETNKRRITLLEKMAEELYREWFVRMRFPGYQNARFVKGVPEGWDVKPSNQIFDVRSGGTPKTDTPQFWDGPIPFFTPKDAPEHIYVGRTEKWITEKGLNSCNSPLYPKNTIFITARGTVGKLALAQRDMAMNQSCYALVPKFDQEVYFFYLAMLNAITVVKGVSKSGVFDNIIVDTFKIIPIYFPGEALVKAFNDIAYPIFAQIEALLSANSNLTKTRDLLLPRLISGKLSVEALDIEFPPSMREQNPEPEPAYG